MFAGFETRRIETSEVEVNLVIGGSGPPVLLLHGYPQTHHMWHLVAPVLADRHTVVAADLRGYGDSSKPESGPGHAAYSKRAMAQDQVEAMAALGLDSFAVVGHDRGGRVAHRMALDHSERVNRLAVLDIVPTHAAATSDLEHDEADLDRRIACPLLALWGDRGRIAQLFDVPQTWRDRASDVHGRAVSCGHFPAEEAPRETADELLAFLTT